MKITIQIECYNLEDLNKVLKIMTKNDDIKTTPIVINEMEEIEKELGLKDNSKPFTIFDRARKNKGVKE